MGYQISDLARRSGFTPSTLRYYETVGLLPAPERTGAGYRVYDDRSLERLAFIARAKALGLALDDIAELVTLWADGPCAPVQDRLRDLLDTKIGAVRRQLGDLSGFAAQLEHLRSSLAVAEPAARCGPGCGCDAVLPTHVLPTHAPVPVALGRPPHAVPIACTLSADQATDRSGAWADLLVLVTTRQRTPSGVRLGLPPDPEVVARAAELAVREADCCAFFSFSITIDARGAALDVAAPPEARGVLDALFEADRG